MSDLKNKLQNVFNELKGLEDRARKLKNQNLADIAASAHGRVKQLCDHPDLELVDERKDQAHAGNPVYVAPVTKEEAIARVRTDNEVDPEGAARANWPHLFDTPLQSGNQNAGAPFPQPAPQPRGPVTGL
jgi:hypothetical protein